jgi:nucleotide-binding universal stress UspA family protein
MSLFNKIVVPLDGSEYADRALEIAIELAGKYSASLVIVHIVPAASALVTGPEVSSAPILLNLSEELEESGRRILEEGTKKAQVTGIHVTTVLEHGNISDNIVRIADAEKADLIVIGERGLGSVARFFLGSVANKVSHHAKCPVLIVKL